MKKAGYFIISSLFAIIYGILLTCVSLGILPDLPEKYVGLGVIGALFSTLIVIIGIMGCDAIFKEQITANYKQMWGTTPSFIFSLVMVFPAMMAFAVDYFGLALSFAFAGITFEIARITIKGQVSK